MARRLVQSWDLGRRNAFVRAWNHKCACCATKINFNDFTKDGKAGRYCFEVDHFIALRFGGVDKIDNLWPLCSNCHATKTQHESVLQKPWCPVCRTKISASNALDHTCYHTKFQTFKLDAFIPPSTPATAVVFNDTPNRFAKFAYPGDDEPVPVRLTSPYFEKIPT